MEIERPRAAPPIKGSDSFDSLFDPSKNNRDSDKLVPPPPLNQPLPVIEQARQEHEPSDPLNTFDDFMERIFDNA